MTREQLERQIELAKRINQENFTRELYCNLYNAITDVLCDMYIAPKGRHATQEEVQTALEYFQLRFFENTDTITLATADPAIMANRIMLELAKRINRESFTRELYDNLYNAITDVLFIVFKNSEQETEE